ncbi:Signal transduction histidine kinase [Agrococcus baldri]|uniref:Signal transduction histidine kinase n=1 Tax=Agrococcus baldri TaxID=153730 RepID=A0AA94HN47_9MICO|nr:sensor histidine kinase [Agrococcus baldri]SFS10232.1 Signal transduction histidine kinase [Agrococcus baldri]
MSIVNLPLSRPEHGEPSRGGSRIGSLRLVSVARAMAIGQHVMAAALTGIGVIRAIGAGTPAAAAVAAGLAILAWHTAGAILIARTGSRQATTLWLLGFVVIWIAAVAVSSEFVWVAFLLWLLAGHLLPGGWAIVFSVAVFAVVALAPFVHHGGTTYANVFGPLIGGVFALGISRGYLELLREAASRERLVDSLAKAQREMSDLQGELALAQRHSGAIAERTRLSRDIHDTIAQSLASIHLIAHAAHERTADPSASRTLEQVETLASESLADVRRIVAALAPAELDDALAAAIGRLLERLGDETGITTQLHVDPSLPLLPTPVEVALLRTAQSALANVRQHASAARVVVSLIDAGDVVRLDIIDDGQGMDAVAWEADGAGSSSYGLRFMRARLRELGGGLDIESAPGDGMALSAHLPLHVADDAPADRPSTEGRP